jgi:hypothetical protein
VAHQHTKAAENNVSLEQAKNLAVDDRVTIESTLAMSLIKGTATGILRDGDLPGPRGFLWAFAALE